MNQMPLQIDLQAIINARVPHKKRRFVPNALIRLVEKIICQEQLNAILRDTHPHEGVAFATPSCLFISFTQTSVPTAWALLHVG